MRRQLKLPFHHPPYHNLGRCRLPNLVDAANAIMPSVSIVCGSLGTQRDEMGPLKGPQM
jgi:hypothetical protein